MYLKEKVVALEHAISQIHDGDRVMVGGFAGTGNPLHLLRALVKQGTKNLTLIANDTGTNNGDKDLGMLVAAKAVKKVIASHIGLNPETCRQYGAKEIEVEFVPQGSLVERIRAGGYGLGGVLTPAGIGTKIAEGKQTLTIEDKEYLLELPLKADVTLIRAKRADKMGNLCYHGTNIAHGTMMVTASKITIVEADEIVEVGALDPDIIDTPSIFVNYVVQGGY